MAMFPTQGFPIVGAVVRIMAGCIGTVLAMEQIFSHPLGRGSGTFLTFGHFFFIAAEACFCLVVRTPDYGLHLRPRRVPLRPLLWLVLLFWGTNVTNNMVFSYRISVPLHTVFRSLQLLVNMLLGFAVGGKSYTGGQFLAILLIATGVFLATMASAPTPKNHTDTEADLLEWLTGLALLGLSMILAGINNLAQEHALRGAQSPPSSPNGSAPLPEWREVMLYTHLLGLPVFVLFAPELLGSLRAFLSHPPLLALWVVNMVTQRICISGVLSLTQLTDGLTMTVVLTLRKALSVCFSVVLFGNVFTATHWMAAALTFGGGLLYARASSFAKPKTE